MPTSPRRSVLPAQFHSRVDSFAVQSSLFIVPDEIVACDDGVMGR